MTSTNLNTGMAPLPPPRSPRNTVLGSPRRITQEDSIAIRGTVECWKKGEVHIDEAVSLLLPEALKRRSYAKEVYDRFVEEVRVEPKRSVLVGSRKALYAASVFANYAGCSNEFGELEASFILSERTFKKSNPEIFGNL